MTPVAQEALPQGATLLVVRQDQYFGDEWQPYGSSTPN